MFGRSNLSSNWRVKSEPEEYPSRHKSEYPRPNKSGSQQSRQVNSNNGVLPAGTLRGDDDPRTLRAIEEGRRLYVGNMPYMAKVKDIEGLFANGDYLIEHINMSTDPFTGRNPSYAFVELETDEQADRAIRELNGTDLLGRPVKIGPGIASKKADRGRSNDPQSAKPTFERWVRTDAAEHWKGYSEQKRRLYVGGLPRMPNHHTVDADVRDLFRGFTIDAVSKVVIPRAHERNNDRYLFVDFPTAEEAERARKAVTGTMAWGVKIHVTHARVGDYRKIDERRNWEVDEGGVLLDDA